MKYADCVIIENIPDAEYQCQTCSRKWKQKPEPVTCICGSIWVDWKNWEQWQKKLKDNYLKNGAN